MIKSLIIFLVAANMEFSTTSEIQYLYIDVINQGDKDCSELLIEFRKQHTTYENLPERSHFILKDGKKMIGGTCI